MYIHNSITRPFTIKLLSLICGLSLFIIPNNAQCYSILQPWLKWVRNPAALPVSVTATNVYADLGSRVIVTLSDTGILREGSGVTATNGFFTASLCIRREYQLAIIASNLTSMTLLLSNAPNWTPMAEQGRGAVPRVYKIYIDREESDDGAIAVTGTGGYYSNSWTIELAEKLPGQWRLEDGTDDPSPAPGDAGFASIGPGKSLSLTNAAITWNVALGRLMDGLSAGRLSVRETAISSNIFKPEVLYHAVSSPVIRDQVALITESSGSPVIRQVKAYQTFVDIITQTNGISMNFYLPSQVGSETNGLGFYTNITGSPFVAWSLTNPGPTNGNQIVDIIECRNGFYSTNEITCNTNSSSATWTLAYGKDNQRRIETRGVTFAYGATTNRLETVDVRYAGASLPAYHALETYQLFPWGFELVETRIDPDNNLTTTNDLVTTFTFNTDTNATLEYGNVSTITYPDGYWEKHLYDAIYTPLFAVLRPMGDIPESVSGATLSNAMIQRMPPNGRGITFTMYPPYDDGPALTNIALTSYAYETADANVFPTSYVGQYALTPPCDDSTWLTEPQYVGSYQHDAGPLMEFGLYNHTFCKSSAIDGDQVNYYNAVTYDATNHTYTMDTNLDASAGPDWRSSSIHTCFGSPVMFSDEESSLRAAWMADGQELFNPVDFGFAPIYFVVNQSYKDSTVYHNGSPVLDERYIFTGSDSGTGRAQNALFSLVYQTLYQNDTLGHVTNVLWIDSKTGVSHTTYSADYRGSNLFDGDLKLSETDIYGIKTIYSYDSLKRIASTCKEGCAASSGFAAQPNIWTYFNYDAYGRCVGTSNVAGDISIVSVTNYDISGRVTSHTDTNGLVTAISYELGGRRVIETMPNGSDKTTEYYLDRRLKSITGTGVLNEYHTWEHADTNLIAQGLPVRETVATGSSNSVRTTSHWYDTANRLILTTRPDCGSSNVISELNRYVFYERSGLLQATYKSGPNGNTMVQLYNHDLVSSNVNGTLLYAEADPDIWGLWRAAMIGQEWGTDRMTRNIHGFTQINGDWFAATTNIIYRAMSDATPTIQDVRLERLNGFTNGNYLAEVKMWDCDTNLTTQISIVDRNAKTLTDVTNVPASIIAATNVTRNGLLQSESTYSVARPTTHSYDAIGREISATTPLGFSTHTVFDELGRVSQSSDVTGLITFWQYYPNGVSGAGQVKSKALNGKSSYFSYTSRNELSRTWGDIQCPEQRIYDAYGDWTSLQTFQKGSQWSGDSWPAVTGMTNTTAWLYDPQSGLLTNKTDAAGHSVSYAYTNGFMTVKTAARGTTITNGYNDYGDIISYSYNDGSPSVLFTNISRTGQPGQIIDGAGTSTIGYDHADRILVTSYSVGPLQGLAVSNHFDGINGRDIIALLGSASPLQISYGYDSLGRMCSVSNDLLLVVYQYVTNSDLLGSTICRSNGAAVLTTARDWDCGVRLRTIANTINGAVVNSHSYEYDGLNRRTLNTLEDGSYWQYGYDNRNELTSAKRRWYDSAPVSGQQYEYSYDNNRTRLMSTFGGNANGENAQTIVYTNNSVDEYTYIFTPNVSEIIGLAIATNSVSVNASNVDRKGEYFHCEISDGNTNGPVWQDVAVVSAGKTNRGGLVVPPRVQTPIYDLDGNVTFDGLWIYQWSSENRLMSMNMTNADGLANANRLRLDFTYDHLGRRVEKVISTWDGSGFISSSTNTFIYDGWNLLAIMAPQTNVVQSFTWGLDLTSSMDGAGGIGGLCIIGTHEGSTTNAFAAYDGNGNVELLVDAADKSIKAKYEYSPYGEMIRSTGVLARNNPFRFSTKVFDVESGLICFPNRYYNPVWGRWQNRDPEGEIDGNNLFAFVANDPINKFDAFGSASGTLLEEDEADSEAAGLDAIAAIGIGAITLYDLRQVAANWNVNQYAIYANADDMDAFEMATQLQDGNTQLALGFTAAALGIKLVADNLENFRYPDDKPVSEILRGKKGSIQNAPLPPGGPSWDTIRNMTWGAVVAAAKAGKPGFSAIKKLLSDKRFDK